MGSEETVYLVNENRRHEMNERENGLEMYRSGSAPPTVEGSLNAVGGLFSHHGDVWSIMNSNINNKRDGLCEEELRSDPDYVSYYYSSANLNPRWPPPLLSKEDWRSAQRVNGGGVGGVGGLVIGGVGDWRKLSRDGGQGCGKVLNEEIEGKGEHGGDSKMGRNEWGGDGLIGLPGLGFGSRQKSIAEIIQDDLDHSTFISRNPSQPPNDSIYNGNVVNAADQFTQLHHEMESTDTLHSSPTSAAQDGGMLSSSTYASAFGASLSRSTSPDPQLIARIPSPRIPLVGEGRVLDKRIVDGPSLFTVASTGPNDPVNIVPYFSALSLSANHIVAEENHMRAPLEHGISNNHVKQDFFNFQGDNGHLKLSLLVRSAEPGCFRQHSAPTMGKIPLPRMQENIGASGNNFYARANGHAERHKLNGASSPPNHHRTGSPSSTIPNYSLSGNHFNPAFTAMMAGKQGGNNLPHLLENSVASAVGVTPMDYRALGGGLALRTNLMASAAELQNLSRAGNHSVGNAPQPIIDLLLRQYLKSTEYAAEVAALADPTMDGANPYVGLLALQKAHLGTLLSSRKSEFGGPFMGSSGVIGDAYYGNQAFGLGMGYGGNPFSSLLPNPHAAYGSCMRRAERNMRFSSGTRNLPGGVMGSWHLEASGIMDQSFGSTLLDEFKTNKTKCFELSEIAGHVVEFSADQYGSRFIQQKLETATTEEKDMVFNEIIPQALSLMTDVFGNYVVQKFFEHGSSSQIRELADKLTGHVLTLSLQMYGCRVIQKAIEVVDLDQQKKMVAELDGHIMRCVRDQNGNHVVQKCIECIPEEAIHFIVSTFFDQIANLSTHPYGCRVIQRILEHCLDPKTQQVVMDEIMLSVCMLAQDQYGNYVVQHVLEHGKPHERSAIISKLTGKIVLMSQQKFASNVIEKCLTFGDPVERRTLVNEMLGTTDENEPLQVMMKDQFANYVVQKVLETCEDQQLESILSRIKTHLTALKKYTYGKHIVARVEKLVAAGERRICLLSAYAAAATSVG
ncbi:hypothetical protein Droror1_Dr00020450 [Drosera rotundifolia]